MQKGLGPGTRAVVAGLAAVISLPVLSLLLADRHRLDAYTGPALSVSYPAGTLISPPRALPSLALIDERGRATTLASFRGRWLVLAPSMTLCREACPLTTATLTALAGERRRDGLRRRVAIAEATVDPWRDTPARLRAYKRLTGASFTLLTGTPAEIHRLWSFLGVFYERVPEGSPAAVDWLTHRPLTFDVQHTDGVFVLDPAGRERVIDEGIAAPAGRLPGPLLGLLDPGGRRELAHPQEPWTAGGLLADLGRLMGLRIPGAKTSPGGSWPVPRRARSSLGSGPPAASPGLPPLRAFAALRAQAGRLLGGYGALARRLARLRGLPVVLNVWASWCPPCRSELPIFAAVARARGSRVAFLGVDVDDSRGAAASVLAQAKLPYPSYEAAIGELDPLAPVQGTPSTIFLDRAGRISYVHPGQYGSRAQLEGDLDRYALAAGEAR